MELIQYIRLFRKWLWLLLLAAFVAGGISFIVSRGRPSVYGAQTTIAIGGFIQSPNPDSAEIRTGIDLAQTYAQLVKTYDVLQGTINALDLPLDSEELQEIVSTKILTGTSLLVVSVNYTDPVMTADIANGLAEQLIQKSPTNLTPEQQAQMSFANAQIAALNQQLVDSRARLELVDSQLQTTQNADETARLTEQRNAIIGQINQASATIAQFSNTVAALQQRTNALDIVERARVPTTPTGASVLTSTLLGAIVGVALAAGVVLLIEYLDDTIRTTESAAQMLALPVLGGIVRFGKKNDSYPQRLVTQQITMSPVSEGYRTVRTNLMFNTNGGSKGIFLVTSAGPEEGKSITAANLAITLAQADLQVLLIDCDLRRPKQHEIFGLKNEVGLTTLLGKTYEAVSSKRLEEGKLPLSLLQCLQTTTLGKLWVITSGFIPSNPTEMLGSSSMQFWMDVFRTSPEIDVVILDTPPCLLATDSSVLAATSKADVLMVVDSGRTRRGAAQRAKEQFTQLGLTVRGVILNRVNPREESYEYNYSYGYYYYAPAMSPENARSLREKILGKRK